MKPGAITAFERSNRLLNSSCLVRPKAVTSFHSVTAVQDLAEIRWRQPADHCFFANASR